MFRGKGGLEVFYKCLRLCPDIYITLGIIGKSLRDRTFLSLFAACEYHCAELKRRMTCVHCKYPCKFCTLSMISTFRPK